MGTRSNIIVQCLDGKVRSIYCHWDGYLDHNGRLLQEHHNTQEKAEALVALGDMSSLGARIDAPEGHSYDNRHEGCTVYYHRDRGEPWADVKPMEFDNTAAAWPEPDTWAEFAYVWSAEHQRWFVAGAHEGTQALVPLDYALEHPESIDANVIVPWLGVVGKHHGKPPLNS